MTSGFSFNLLQYGGAQSGPLPIGDFQWLYNFDNFYKDWHLWNDNQTIGYILEVRKKVSKPKLT